MSETLNGTQVATKQDVKEVRQELKRLKWTLLSLPDGSMSLALATVLARLSKADLEKLRHDLTWRMVLVMTIPVVGLIGNTLLENRF